MAYMEKPWFPREMILVGFIGFSASILINWRVTGSFLKQPLLLRGESSLPQ